MLDLKRLNRLERPAPFFFATRYAKELSRMMDSQGVRFAVFCPMELFPARYPDLPQAQARPSVPVNVKYPKAVTDDPAMITVVVSSFRPHDLNRMLLDLENDPRTRARLDAVPRTDPDGVKARIKPRP